MASLVSSGTTNGDPCVYRKIKPARSDGEVRPRWRTNLWDRIAEPAENSAYLCLETDGFWSRYNSRRRIYNSRRRISGSDGVRAAVSQGAPASRSFKSASSCAHIQGAAPPISANGMVRPCSGPASTNKLPSATYGKSPARLRRLFMGLTAAVHSWPS